MKYQPIEITGYREEDSPEPLYDGTDRCRVYLPLSATPRPDWSDMFLSLSSGGATNGGASLGERVRLSGQGIELTTMGDAIQDDIRHLRDLVSAANAEFERVHEAALKSQKQVATILQWEFPEP